ncbi:glutathionylspermidine synthase [Gordoniibacillus kamchatkensis]|uniref:Glutathionylspermidine synthase n=1 Tax=Gordoniibacillus kamchatkensis TaxID=1590651 RepID=A0ABR5AMT1_9BACL|nr:glutathionylspermidine synthase family protein [Paenibacillus sp. VKM B-2647]KIL42123.1 glutathionylspermidine synthase [Paenibacillus sp. VKM B-2647]
MSKQGDVFRVVSEPAADRPARVEELRKLGFTWADQDGQPYWIDQLVTIDKGTYERLVHAATLLWTVFDKAARFVHGRRDLYELLSVPEVLWDGLDRLPLSEPGRLSRYARFDFSVSSGGGIRLLELNADTPTAYVEASVATPWLCAQHAAEGVRCVNGRMPELLRRAWAAEQPEAACCAGYGTHLEDSGTIDMLVRHSGRAMRCLDTLSLSIDEGVLKDGDGQPIERIFMLYPKEWMGIDDGGEALAYAAETGHVAISNSYHAVLLQSKGLQAVIWGLHEIGVPLFSPEEHEAIEAYMLPTYNEPVLAGNYVSKAMFGREGGSVELYGAKGELDARDADGYDTSRWFRRVYQARADLPEVGLHAEPMRLLTGMFVIDGEPCGIVGRAGGLITGNASHFVAMGVRE